ncbi:PKD domain-containing protein [Zobellia amurskyensis]|uniref:PKD domain-containing protein n=1 Tax=Zobellia amurskyensis TaxID=248905 RepID=A0A7X2ZS83_9FLAO|nr:PKD domain-containing protein [Zobellia amurskyensis]MUH35438.1 PKD domain-containing protein [Zobellia amurskyensis]
MKLYPKKTLAYSIGFVALSFLLNLSCNKDVDTLREAVLDKTVPVIDDEEDTSGEVTEQSEETALELDRDEVVDVIERENRTVVFYPVHDAYIQNGIGYNEEIIRLQEERRTSYLMFDLSPIDSIGGEIISANLEFVIHLDDGNGEIDVFKGGSNDWTETELSEKSAPEQVVQLGTVNQEYRIENRVSIDLDTTYLQPSLATLVLGHKNGDDLAFSAKEDADSPGSALVVEYTVPVGSESIIFNEPDPILDEKSTDEINEENEAKEEDVPQSNTTEENVVEEVDVEDEKIEEEVVEEDVVEEKIIKEEVVEEEKIEEETSEPSDSIIAPIEIPNMAPVALAEASPSTGKSPLKVTFTGSNSTDDVSVVSYKWDFEGGKTSNEINPVITFDEVGNYDVKLTVTDEYGLSHTNTVIITVEAKGNVAPVAKLSADVENGNVPLEVSFNGNSSTDDNGIAKYSWDFKDGSSSNEINPAHTFEEEGNYAVELIVEDENGLTHKDVITITVESTADQFPVAKANASKTSGTIPLQIDFTAANSVDDNGITKYVWDFKDGNSSDKEAVSHTFKSAGDYVVELTVTDSKGQTNKTTLKINAQAPTNEPPSAKLTTNLDNGTAPLKVNFTGSGSADDNGIVKYAWNFQDGSFSDQANSEHTFNEPGTYNVELTVEDAAGLRDTKTTSITVVARQNEAPVAKASASLHSGYAPLKVDFNGSSSTDDLAISSYYWDFTEGSSSKVTASHTFNNPGVYNVSFTVTDEEGLTSTDNLTVEVTQAPIGNIDCSAGGGKANESGAKIWCWNNVSMPDYSGQNGPPISNDELKIDSECYEKQVTQEGSRLKFRVDPINPKPGSWCARDFNMRAEISTLPWKVKHPKGTEEWFGWDYTFGNDYVIDKSSQWLFFQVHPGITGESPHMELMVIKDNQAIGHDAGEIFVINAANGKDYHPTGITPSAGQKLKIVVHAIWDDASKGHLQVWINGNKVYDKQVATVYSRYPWGGNAKWGIYKWPWANEADVQESKRQGVSHIETYMGTLRMVTRKPGDADYGSDAYSLVAPD